MEQTEKALKQMSLIELAKLMHQYENKDDDIGVMGVADEVRERSALQEFQQLYMQVWPECNNQ